MSVVIFCIVLQLAAIPLLMNVKRTIGRDFDLTVR